jgi:guanylate kinase
VGPSGVGKGSIAAGLVSKLPGLWLSRSWTTRPRRPGEAPDAYSFVDRATFEARQGAGGFLESAAVFDHLYGTPWPEPPPGADVLLEIDVQGAGQVKERYPDAVVILVRAPSPEAQEARLRGRGDDHAVIVRRLARAAAEERDAATLADHVVVNDDLDRAVEEAAAIVESHRSQR